MAAQAHPSTSNTPSQALPVSPLKEETVAEEDGEFFCWGELERGIPMEDKDDGDILYNLGSLTVSQSYSKLEKTLFGLAPQDDEDQQSLEMLE